MHKDSGRVLVAMSGGVDSSVAALLLCRAGYQVIGVTMDTGYGSAAEQAAAICHQLGLEHVRIDVRQQFRTQVIEPFIAAYLSGETPNPCVQCNQFLKFRVFEPLLPKLDAQFLATGHYCRLERIGGRLALCRGRDTEKDQTYFLYGIPQEVLTHCLFPLGTLCKEEVRQLAQDAGLLSARARESYDICFIEDGDYRRLIAAHADERQRAGDIVDRDGRVVGRHHGLANYTIGQRRGLEVALGYPAYVVGFDVARNRLLVDRRDALLTRLAYTADNNFFPFPVLKEERDVQVKVRYRAQAKHAVIRPSVPGGLVEILFAEDEWGVTPGQSAVFYDGDMLLGGGRIVRME